MPLITLTTDFGIQDHYVAVMKGVILGIAPQATIVDITHRIEPHNILHGAFVLRQVVTWFPEGTVHVVVIDPGVGSDRRILVGRYSGQIIIAPDNGVMSFVHRDLQLQAIHTVQNTRFFLPAVSPTFHGRDIMAPVAAHLVNGCSIDEIGPPTKQIEVLQLPKPEYHEDRGLIGQVLYADHFGNLITNIARADLAEVCRRSFDVRVYVGDACAGPIHQTYADVPVGEPVALIGSSEMLEISVHRGRAQDRFGYDSNTPIIVR